MMDLSSRSTLFAPYLNSPYDLVGMKFFLNCAVINSVICFIGTLLRVQVLH